MGSAGLWQWWDAWVVAVVVGVPALTKVVIVGIALRGAAPADRPRIITAVAELFRWWRPGRGPTRHD